MKIQSLTVQENQSSGKTSIPGVQVIDLNARKRNHDNGNSDPNEQESVVLLSELYEMH